MHLAQLHISTHIYFVHMHIEREQKEYQLSKTKDICLFVFLSLIYTYKITIHMVIL